VDDLSAAARLDGGTGLAILAALAVAAEPRRTNAGCHAEGRSLVIDDDVVEYARSAGA
jgi:hypothetical protein